MADAVTEPEAVEVPVDVPEEVLAVDDDSYEPDGYEPSASPVEERLPDVSSSVEEGQESHVNSSDPTPAPEVADSLDSKPVEEAIETSEVVPKALAKRKRLPQDVIGQLEDNIAENPLDIQSWHRLIGEFKAKEKLDDLRETFERMLKHFPTSAETWIDYLDMEQSNGEFVHVEQLFSRCLPKVLNVKLWTYYLAYIRRVNNINSDGEKARNTIGQAYEFALDRIGIDKDAGSVWAEYIEFIKSSNAPTTWEQQQKMDQLRKTYRSATAVPISNLETLWQAYNSFETNLNKTTARKFTAERSVLYMNARSSLRELERLTKNLDRSTTPSARRWSVSEDEQAALWEKWIKWEKKNPLESEDKAVVKARVSYAYSQSVMALRYFPQSWFNAADYSFKNGEDANGMEFLKNGLVANPTSFLLSLKLAEVLEREGNFDELKNTLDNLTSALKASREKLEAELAGSEAKLDPKIQGALDESALNITTAYTEYMKVMRRSQGIREARRVFGEVRKLTYVTHHVFVAAAMMEFYDNREGGVANKIFELGLRRFGDVTEFVLTYLQFLIANTDGINARALFEKSVTKMSPTDARPLYETFLDYEANYGELSALMKLETRFMELYPDESPLSVFERRHRVLNYDAIRSMDFGGSKPRQTGRVSSGDVRHHKRAKEDDERDVNENNVVPASILQLLQILPPASSYNTVTFDAVKIVQLFKDVRMP